jgi:alcohol dehydrogenase class IV
MALRPVLTYNAVVAGAKVAQVLDHMGFTVPENRTKDCLPELLEQLNGFLAQIGLGARLGEFGFQESHMDTIVQATLASAQRPTNPRDPSAEDIAGIVHDMV